LKSDVYDCPLSQSSTWQSLSETSKRIGATFDLMIYDNSPTTQLLPATSINIHYRHNGTNVGVSKAYNEGFKLALRLKKKWLLLLDQDSSFPPRWMEFYAKTIAEDNADQKVIAPIVASGRKIISPFNYWICLGRSPKTMISGIKSPKNHYVINSGLLISTSLFEKAGGYDERIPMDFSDFAFMHKLKALNIQLNVIGLPLNHNLSSLQRSENDKDQVRFQSYCIGSKRFAEYTHRSGIHFLVCIFRGIKFGIYYRTFGFIKIVLRSWATA
jgi:rhamnosyltransferase